MRAVKRINHNAAICEDNAGRQLIALGRGIGFGDLPREISLKDVHRTFYGIDSKYLSFIDEVDPDVLEFSAQLADVVSQQVSYELSPNLPITLADHIQFAIHRAREHIIVQMPLAFDVEQNHPVEYHLAEMALRGVRRTFSVRMPKSEAAGIALSIVNAAVSSSAATTARTERMEHMIARAAELIEADMGVTVNRGTFAFARFATHMQYLLDRVERGEPIQTENSGLYEVLVEQYPEVVACASKMNEAIAEEYDTGLTQEEQVYLILHINRVVSAALEGTDECENA